jgi:hypothetical protein
MKREFIKDCEKDGQSSINYSDLSKGGNTSSTYVGTYKKHIFLPFLKERDHLGRLLDHVKIYFILITTE